MAILDLKPFFTVQHQGQAPYLHIFSHAIAPTRDTAIRDDDKEALADALKKSTKHQSIVIIFGGAHPSQKGRQINQLSYQTGQTVCLIDCALLTEKYIGETEKNLAKLIADAENKNWILFFDEADALFTPTKRHEEQKTTKVLSKSSGILKHISQYQGLSVINIQQKQHLSQVELMADYMINFND